MIRQKSTPDFTPQRAFCVLILTLLFCTVVPMAAPQVTDAALVQQFFPQRLIDEASVDFSAGGPAPFQTSDFVAADLNGTGSANFLVAAYTNGFSAVVRILRKEGASAVVAAEPQLPLMAGVYPSVSLIDLDNDGRPEVVVSLSSARGATADWIFKWDGTNLKTIGPTQAQPGGNVTTLLGDAVFADLTGDDSLAIINPPEFNSAPPGSTAPATFAVFTLSGGAFVPSTISFNFFQTFARQTGKPVIVTQVFSASNANVPYVLTITNGDGRGGKRVSSATITLNNAVVARPEDFNQQVLVLKIPVTALNSNTLSVELASAPGAQLSIGIGPK